MCHLSVKELVGTPSEIFEWNKLENITYSVGVFVHCTVGINTQKFGQVTMIGYPRFSAACDALIPSQIWQS